MAYFKKFWEERHFNEIEEKGEYRTFIYDRFNKIMDIPYSFVIIALSHHANFTEKKRQVMENQLQETGTEKRINFFDTWEPETQIFINDLANYLKKIAQRSQGN